MGTPALFTFVHNEKEIFHLWNKYDGQFEDGQGERIYRLIEEKGIEGLKSFLYRIQNAKCITKSEGDIMFDDFCESQTALDKLWNEMDSELRMNSIPLVQWNQLYPILGTDVLLAMKALLADLTLVDSIKPTVIIQLNEEELQSLKEFTPHLYVVNLDNLTYNIKSYDEENELLINLRDTVNPNL